MVEGLARWSRSLSIMYRSLTDSYSFGFSNRSLQASGLVSQVDREDCRYYSLLHPGHVEHITGANDLVQAGVFGPLYTGLGRFCLDVVWHGEGRW